MSYMCIFTIPKLNQSLYKHKEVLNAVNEKERHKMKVQDPQVMAPNFGLSSAQKNSNEIQAP